MLQIWSFLQEFYLAPAFVSLRVSANPLIASLSVGLGSACWPDNKSLGLHLIIFCNLRPWALFDHFSNSRAPFHGSPIDLIIFCNLGVGALFDHFSDSRAPFNGPSIERALSSETGERGGVILITFSDDLSRSTPENTVGCAKISKIDRAS
jgi:hypothetical protein